MRNYELLLALFDLVGSGPSMHSSRQLAARSDFSNLSSLKNSVQFMTLTLATFDM